MISGINGGNCILAGTAKLRIDQKMILGANIIGQRGSYTIQFYGPGAEWNGKKLVLCSQRNPYEARLFKSLDGAVSQLSTIGLGNPIFQVHAGERRTRV